MDLVLTKWIALKGTSVLASCRVEELSSRFPSVMIRDAAGFTCYLSTEREYQISGGYGAAAIYPLGIRRALEYAGADKCRYGN